MCKAPGSLTWCKEGNNDLSRATAFAAQFAFDLDQRETVAKMRPKLHQGKPRRVFALTAVRPVIVRVIDVCEGCGFKFGVLHSPRLSPGGCGLLVYNSYSISMDRELYNLGRCNGYKAKNNSKNCEVH